jgi:hypothetical protein
VDTESALRPPPSDGEARIGPLGTFASAALESAFRQRHFRDDLWLCRFLVAAGMLRVALLLLADYQQFGLGPSFWPLLAGRFLFLLLSALALVALRRAASFAAIDRTFFGWSFLLAGLTVSAISARPPSSTGLLLMSFGPVLVAYCVAPLPLSRQVILALTYSVVVLSVSWGVDGAILSKVCLVYALTNLFGAITSWRLNHRRREAFLGSLREARLRASLEEAVAEIKTLRGLLCICAWCKRARDEAGAWQTLESYVESRTHAEFTHGICPDCVQSQTG